jgi:hypothetical protein
MLLLPLALTAILISPEKSQLAERILQFHRFRRPPLFGLLPQFEWVLFL